MTSCVLALGVSLAAVPDARAGETRSEPATAAAEQEVAPSRLSLAPSGLGGGDRFEFGAIAGIGLEPLHGVWTSTHLVLSGGYLRELVGADGAWLRLAVSQDIARLRLGAAVHSEHVFSPGRDGIDVLVVAGASYAVVGPLHAGVEYVAQDLEEALEDRAEGGVRHFLRPQLSLELVQKRLSIVAGPAFGLGPTSPNFPARMSISYQY